MMKKVLYGVALTLFAGVSVGSLQSCKDDVNDIATQTSYDLTKLRSQLTSEAARLDGRIDALAARHQADIDYINGQIGDLQQADAALAAKVDGAITRLDNIEPLVADHATRIEFLEGQAEAMQNELEALKSTMQENDEVLYQLIMDTQEFLTQALNAHAQDIQDLQNQIDQIMTAIDNITARLDKQVSGILIQGVNSPVFGDFRTPLGVKSNILFNWYGYNDRNKDITFPSNDAGISATGAPALPSNLSPASTWTANVGYYGDQIGDVTLGTVYVTLNPVGAQFDNLELSIEKSNGEALPYKVTLKPSSYELKHGFSRADDEEEETVNSTNGFYEGEVVMALNDDNVGQIEVAIEEDLKTALKDIVKDPSKVTAKALVNAVFQQLQGKIPAYGLRYSWYGGLTDDMDPSFSANAYSVLSQYDLAVATARPLSYNTFKGVGGSTQLPTFGHIQNFINKIKELGDFTINFGEFDVKGFTVKLGDITFKDEVNGKISITIPGLVVVDDKGNPTGDYTASVTVDNAANTEAFVASIESAIQSALSQASDDINLSVEEMVDSINEQVNKMMASINEQIGGKIDSILGNLDKLEPYYGKINAAIDLYNKIATKINNFIADPNAYMQVAAFYNMGGANYGIVSGRADDPTPFVGNGEAFKLYLSSYTAELIVPACKKYVAVTAVKGNDPRSISAINTELGEEFNAVLDGNQIEVSVPKAALKTGNVYEFTYQALDYRGYTSTKKFYIEVK